MHLNPVENQSISLYPSASFRPEPALSRRGGVNLRAFLCGVEYCAYSQILDFIGMTKNGSFPT